ncbi:PIR protein CIR protein [Plasmodium vinckei lentum]|uniref:PIR protein CIR protein n=1 Tax=Plasmodium vinckei lentum TaxID=138297 RepID=A0A6V7SKB3_PLAVN|nr:PIR protein CIR protein [Plasmodium vinckei lentum]
MSKIACKLFRDADEMFNGKFVDGGKFNDNYSLYTEYCPQGKNGVKKCNTDYEKISAVGGYLFMKLNRSIYMNLDDDNDRYVQYFIIWISHKLHKIAINNIAFLNQTYEENLGKSIGNFNFWNLINNQKKGLKNSNIAIMNMFYILFNQICETIHKYNTPDIQPHEYTHSAIQCNIIYDELSKFVNDCGPYIGILAHLKTVFDDFINTATSENLHGEGVLSQLKKFSSIDKTNAGSSLKSKKCRKVHQKLIKSPPALIKKEIKRLKAAINKNLQKTSNPESSGLIVPQTQEGTGLTNYPSGLDILAIPSEGEDDDAEDNNVGDGDEDDDTDGDKEGGNAGGDKEGGNADGGKEDANGDSGEDDDNGDSDEEDSDEDGDDDASDDETDTQTDINSGLGHSQDKHDTQGSEQKGPDDGQINHPTSPNNQIGNPGSSDGGQGDMHKEPGNSTNQQNDQSGTQDDSSKQQGDPGSIEKLKNIFSSVQNKLENYRSSLYETSANIGKRLYDNVSSTLGNAYNGSITFGKTIITNLNEKIEKTINNFMPSNDKPELQDPKKEPPSKDNLQNPPTLNNNPSEPNPPGPSPPVLPPPEPSPPVLPPPEPSSPILSPTGPDPPPLQPKGPDPSTLPSKGLSPENNKVHNGQPQCKRNNDPTPQVINGGSQISVDSMTSPVVKQKDAGTEVKGNITTGIGDMHILKGYKHIGISIIVILIPIALTIMYKYLSSGWRKEMKRKKNMKKVINSIGGKRTVQIIIKSVDTKKMTNPIIKPIHGGKKSLLNIYKLMQADSVPFINLFFLLIFFVYKRKLNYLEL